MDQPPYATVYYRDYEKNINVSVIAPTFLYTAGHYGYGKRVVLLEALGPHSAVRGVLAALATGRSVRSSLLQEEVSGASEGARILTGKLSAKTAHGFYVSPLVGRPQAGEVAFLDDAPEHVFRGLMNLHTVPALPEWAPWICQELRNRKKLTPLEGTGGKGVVIEASETELDEVVSHGVKSKAIAF